MTKDITNEKIAAYSKYLPKKHNPITTFIKGNVIMFLLGSVAWLYFSHQNSYEPEMREYVGPSMDNRTYVEAVKDAYIPFYKGKFDPHITWMANVCFQIILALACVGIAMRQKSKRKEQEHDIDVMLEIEKLAKEHQLDATAAKKMLAIAPEIVKHMSEDSRVYFDMIMDGKVSTTDENFMNIASAVMAGHLQTHPEDLDRVMSVFDDKAISAELLNMYTQQNNRNSK